jgi:integrase
MNLTFRAPIATTTPASPHPADLFAGRVEINWPYLIERRPLTLQLAPELPEYLLLPEVHRLLDSARHPRDHLLVSLLWHTGARISEALAITPEHLMLQDEWSSGVLLNQLKKRGRPRQVKRQTMRKRWVPMTDETFVLTLARYVEGQGLKSGDRLFPFTRQWAYNRIRQLSDRAALPISQDIYELRTE